MVPAAVRLPAALMLRSTWYLLNLVVWTIWYGGSAIVAGLLGVKQRPGGVYDRAARNWSRRLLRASGVTVETVGARQIPDDRPVVFVSNHQSWFDILAIAATIPGTVRFVAKKEMQSIPLLGRAMRAAGHMYIDRHNRAAAFSAYEEAASVINRGLSAVVFAEGTRSRTGQLLPFKKGPFVLAIAAQVPVVPLYVANTFEILPKGSLRVRPRPVTLYVGQPIETAGLDYEARGRLLDDVRAVIEGFRDRARAEGRAPPVLAGR